MTSNPLTEINAQIKICNACGLNDGHHLAVPGRGSHLDNKLFILAEAPGRDESDPELHKGKEFGTPLVGPAGQKLQSIMAAIGFGKWKDSLFITNVLKHRPPKNRPPEQAEKRLCTPLLLLQLAHIKPRVILALGKHASETLHEIYRPKISKPDRYQGLIYHNNHNTTTSVFNTYHPSYACLRNPDMEPIFVSDLRELYSFMEGLYERNNS